MKKSKINLANIYGKLSRAEMKNIMAGSDDDSPDAAKCNADCTGDCTFSSGGTGKCSKTTAGKCQCHS